MIDRKHFFDTVRPLFGTMTTEQVAGMGTLLDYWETKWLPHNLDLAPNIRWLAYALATTFHETGRAMVPVREGGGDAYLRAKAYWPFYGRGYPQLTWDYNYKAWSVRLGVDLVADPDKALDPEYACPILFDSMARGYFTGRRLGQYFGANARADDPVGARRIVNGTNDDVLIAGYHTHSFLPALVSPANVVSHA